MSRKKIPALTESQLEFFVERADCQWRPLCCEVHVNQPQLPCLECDDYVKAEINKLIYNIDLEELDRHILSGYQQWGKIYMKRAVEIMA